MNYLHAYHAGNFADCFKHALLVTLLEAFTRKPTPYFVLDTHAGTGWYDLNAEESRRTGEANVGIQRLIRRPLPALAHYLGLVSELGLYPGSPALIRRVLRENDRLVCCELHPREASSLRRRFRCDPQVEVHERSGWEALGALLPPREKRGLVFIDPPFEERDEFRMLLEGIQRGHGRFSNGIFAAWYPVKQLAAVRAFHAGLRSSRIRDIVAMELHLRHTTEPDRLNGCGLVVINPPYDFENQALAVAQAVLEGLDADEGGAATTFVRLTDE